MVCHVVFIMNNSVTEYINYKELYEIGVHLLDYSNDIKTNLNVIDSLLKRLGEDNIWKGLARDSILTKYLNERENLNLLYLKLVYYSKFILEIVVSSEEFTLQATKILEGLNDSLLWPI